MKPELASTALRPSRIGPRVGTIVMIAALAAVLARLPSFDDYSAYVVAIVIVQVIAVLSLNLLMGYAGQVSLGQAALVGVGAYGTHQLRSLGAPFPVDYGAAIVTTVALATILGLPALRIRGLQLAALTLAFGLAAERLLFARPWDQSSTAGVVVTRPDLLSDDRALLVVAIAALLVVLSIDTAVRRSRIGRAFYAVRDREDLAAAWGIPTGATKLLAYALSGLYAGIAGGLYAFLVERLTPTPFDVWRSLGYVAAVIIGGAGSMAGVAIAAAALTGLPELFRSTAQYTPLVGAILLMIVPVLRPDGLSWLTERRVRLYHARGRVRERGQGAARTEGPALMRASTDAGSRPLSLSIPVRTLLTAEHLQVGFGGLRVLQDVSLEISRGELVGLIGPNGAGKTTFFNVVSGFVTPQRGSVRYRGRDLLAMPAWARPQLGIGRTFQHAGLCPSRTVRDNVLIAQHHLARYGVAAALLATPLARAVERDLGHRADEALAVVDLLELADEPVGSLPYGKQRLAEVAAVLASGPEVLLLDEPAAGLGPDEAEDLGHVLARFHRDLGLTVLMIEHHIPLVAELCSQVYVLADGHVLAHGDPSSVQRDPAVIRIYLGESDGTESKALIRG